MARQGCGVSASNGHRTDAASVILDQLHAEALVRELNAARDTYPDRRADMHPNGRAPARTTRVRYGGCA